MFYKQLKWKNTFTKADTTKLIVIFGMFFLVNFKPGAVFSYFAAHLGSAERTV